MNYPKIISSTPVTMVNFVVDWCPHCQRMLPVYADVRDAVIEEVNTFLIDCERHPDIGDRADITVYPTSVVYKEGVEVWRGTGEFSADDLKDRIRIAGKSKPNENIS